MKKNILMWILGVLLLCSVSFAVTDEYYVNNVTSVWYLNDSGLIYTKNISVPDENVCTGDWDGSYPCTNLWDGNFDNDARLIEWNGDYNGYAYLNFTKPSGAISANWTIYYEEGTYGSTKLSTIKDIPQSCFNYNAEKVLLKLHSRQYNCGGNPCGSVVASCYNGSDYYTLLSSSGGTFNIDQANRNFNEQYVQFDIKGQIQDAYKLNNGTLYGKTFYHGTNSGATSVDQTGSMDKFGKAYSFDSNDKITSQISSSSSITYSAFVYPTSTSDMRIISSENTDYFYLRRFTDGKFYVVSTGLSDTLIGSTNIIPLNTWSYITFTYDGTSKKIFLNGNLENTETATGNITAFTSISVGQKGNNANKFNGTIDEVRIWNRALTSTEIQEEMNSNAVANPEGIVAYYDFNERSGTTVYDNNHLSTGARQSTSSIDDPIFSYDKATNFDGVDDYVYVNTTDINPNNSSVCVWAKPYSGGSSAHIFSHYDSGANNQILLYRDGLNFFTNVGSSAVDTGGNFILNTYSHICLTWGLGSYNAYLNGANIKTGTYTGLTTPGDFKIGINEFNGANAFNGSIADVRIYDRALNEDEVYAIYSGTDALTTIETDDYFYDQENATILIAGDYYLNSIDVDSQFTEIQTKQGNYTISLIADGTVLTTYEVELNETSNTLNFSDTSLNYVYFQDAKDNSSLTSQDVSIKYPSGTTISRTTDTEGKINFTTFQSHSVEYGTYQITYEDNQGYVTPVTFTYEATTLPFNITYNISRTTININIYDRLTGNPLLENASIIFQGVGNFSTNTGNYTFDAVSLASGDYTILVKSDGYFTEQKLFTFDNQEIVNLSFYLLENNASSSVTVTIQVTDTTQTKIENAQVNMLEYDLATLSYISVSQGYTNSEGEIIFLAELNDKTYKFTASKEINGFLRTGNSGDGGIIFRDEIVAGSPITFEQQKVSIILTGFEDFDFNPSLYLRYDITENFNETTNISTIKVDFSTSDSSDVTMCIEFFSVEGATKTSELQICDTGSAGTITPNTPFLLNRSKTYQLDVYTLDEEIRTVLQTFRYQSISSFQEVLKIYSILKPAVLFFWIIIIGIGLFSTNLVLAGVLGIILSVIEFIIFPNLLTASGGILKIIICIQIIHFGRKKEDFN